MPGRNPQNCGGALPATDDWLADHDEVLVNFGHREDNFDHREDSFVFVLIAIDPRGPIRNGRATWALVDFTGKSFSEVAERLPRLVTSGQGGEHFSRPSAS